MTEKVLKKIIKNLKSVDDNDKLAALSYIIKLYPTPTALLNSESSAKIFFNLIKIHFFHSSIKLG